MSGSVLEAMAARYAPLDGHWVDEVGCFRIAEGPTHSLDVTPLNFTVAIVTTPNGQSSGHDNRWCYHSLQAAIVAAETWAASSWPEGEPTGWHRYSSSGRRRVHGEPAAEYVAP